MKCLSAFLLLFFSNKTVAFMVENTKLQNVYVQSLAGNYKSEAHAIRIDKPIDASCNHRLYINAQDKDLLSAVLAFNLSGKRFSLHYSINQPRKLVKGHLIASCELYSVW